MGHCISKSGTSIYLFIPFCTRLESFVFSKQKYQTIYWVRPFGMVKITCKESLHSPWKQSSKILKEMRAGESEGCKNASRSHGIR